MNMLKMMKDAVVMQKEMKKMQQQLARETVEASGGGVTVIARCDMSIERVMINMQAMDAGKSDQLAKQITSTVNDALTAAKKKAGSAMTQMSGGLRGLADMLG